MILLITNTSDSDLLLKSGRVWLLRNKFKIVTEEEFHEDYSLWMKVLPEIKIEQFRSIEQLIAIKERTGELV